MEEMLETIVEAIAQDYPNPRDLIGDIIGTGISNDMETELAFIELPRQEKKVLINKVLKNYGY